MILLNHHEPLWMCCLRPIMQWTLYPPLYLSIHPLVHLFVREAATPSDELLLTISDSLAAGRGWSWISLAKPPVLMTTILGKKLKMIQEHGSRCCRVNNRQARLRLASFPVCEQEPFGRGSRWLSDSLSAFINLSEIMCFSLSACRSACQALLLPVSSVHQSTVCEVHRLVFNNIFGIKATNTQFFWI